MSDRERLEIVAHELRSPVAALAALLDALPTVPRPARRRVVDLAVAAGRDIERICGRRGPRLAATRARRSRLARRRIRVGRRGGLASTVSRRSTATRRGSVRRSGTSSGTGCATGRPSRSTSRSATERVVARRLGRRAGRRARRSTRSRGGRATRASTGIGLWLVARGSPRRTAARSTSSRTAGPAPASGSLCRPLPPRAEPELALERAGALRRSRDASPRARARRSRRGRRGPRERSHSSVLNVTSESAALSVSCRAPRSSFQRAIAGACQSRATAGSAR